MLPLNLQGVPWDRNAANMVLNRLKRDVADKLLRDDVAKAKAAGATMPDNGVVTKMFDADGQVTTDPAAAVKIMPDPLLMALRHDGRAVRLLTRKMWAKFLTRRRDETLVHSAAAYTVDDPMGDVQPKGTRRADPKIMGKLWHSSEAAWLATDGGGLYKPEQQKEVA